ncbi:MAG: FxsA family protein [Alkalispirochaetaceae bacterium]
MRLDRLFDRGNLARLVSLLLLAGLLGLADGYLLVLAAERLGVYLALAIEASTALLALGIVGSSIHSKLRRVRNALGRNEVPLLLYGEILVLILSLALLIAPGFLSDLLGAVIFLIPLRTGLAWLITRLWARRLAEAHEYLKMRVFSDYS